MATKTALLDRQIGQEIESGIARENYLRDNCECVETLDYMKAFDPDQIILLKNDLSDSSIRINDIEVEKKAVAKDFKEQLKPMIAERSLILLNLKQKSEMVTEKCYKFVDTDAKMTGYYSKEGILVSARSMTPDEMQKNIFEMNGASATGTND